MWQFAIGLYLVQLSDKTSNQLLLAAVFGFTCCGLIILFGSLIGDWVDRNGRLKGKTAFAKLLVGFVSIENALLLHVLPHSCCCNTHS